MAPSTTTATKLEEDSNGQHDDAVIAAAASAAAAVKENDDDDDDGSDGGQQQQQQESIMSSSSSSTKLLFRRILPPSRLGQEHETLGSFRRACWKKKKKKKATTTTTTKDNNNKSNNADDDDEKQQQQSSSSSSRKRNNKIKTKAYSLVVVVDPLERKILLGMKHRGFGKGMYTLFGGKMELNESPHECARRELREETGISMVTPNDDNDLAASKIGRLFFTFDNDDENDDEEEEEMIVHLFRLNVCTTRPTSSSSSSSLDNNCLYVDPNQIKGCDEITPEWFNWYETLPLDRMFADDSLWLTKLLLSIDNENDDDNMSLLALDGWFHYEKGGQEVNSIQHYYIDFHCTEKNKKQQQQEAHDHRHHLNNNNNNNNWNLERRLYNEIHVARINSPSIKEFNEAYAFCQALRLKQSKSQSQYELVIDVAGGHGALGALFVITTPSISRAVIIDPAIGINGIRGIQLAWHKYLQPPKNNNNNNDSNNDEPVLRYRHECLRTALPDELHEAIYTRNIPRDKILVVACHACQHLSDEIMEISLNNQVSCAVMPCCQKDNSKGQNWKSASKNLGISVATTMDLLLAGKCMSWNLSSQKQQQQQQQSNNGNDNVEYDVRMRVINPKITPQNRLIYCRAVTITAAVADSSNSRREKTKEERISNAHNKLQQAYRRAHIQAVATTSSSPSSPSSPEKNTTPPATILNCSSNNNKDEGGSLASLIRRCCCWISPASSTINSGVATQHVAFGFGLGVLFTTTITAVVAIVSSTSSPRKK